MLNNSAADSKKLGSTSTSVKATRKGPGTLMHEGMPGLDAFYDPYDKTKISNHYRTIGSQYGVPGKATWAFDTKVARPWQKPPDLRFGRHLAPGDYEQYSPNHLLSASMSWGSRGRCGPMGSTFDESRQNSQFASVTHRGYTQSPTKQPSKATKEDVFILRTDYRKDHLQRAGWAETLSQRVHDHHLARPQPEPPRVFDFFAQPATPPTSA